MPFCQLLVNLPKAAFIALLIVVVNLPQRCFYVFPTLVILANLLLLPFFPNRKIYLIGKLHSIHQLLLVTSHIRWANYLFVNLTSRIALWDWFYVSGIYLYAFNPDRWYLTCFWLNQIAFWLFAQWYFHLFMALTSKSSI